MSIRVVTDNNCDLPQEVIARYGITVVPLHITIGSDSYLDGVEMSRAEFYTGLPDFSAHPTTSVPSPGQFYEVYDRLAQEGATGILSIHISTTVHTHAPDRATALHQRVKYLVPTDEAPLSEEVTPVIGAHVGPNAVGFVAVQLPGTRD